MKHFSRRGMLAGSLAALSVASCDSANDRGDRVIPPVKIGLAFDSLRAEFWRASFKIIKDELKKRRAEAIEAVAEGDASRQLEQVKDFAAGGVDGLIVVPKDGGTGASLVMEANQASIPIVFYGRPPADNKGKYVAVQADNFAISKTTVMFMARTARVLRGKFQALLLMGDLEDLNSIGRRDGFEAAVAGFTDTIEIVARIATQWNQETARAASTAALSAHPDINFIYASSDFLLPSIATALQAAGKYKKIGEPGHVILGSFDGDSTAYRLMQEGYLDAEGVPDIHYECHQAIYAVLDLHDAKDVPRLIRDPGFLIHQGNLETDKARMWGAATAEI